MARGNILLRGDEGVLDRGPRHLPVLKAHPFRRRPGEVWLRCIDTTVPLLDVLDGAYQEHANQFPEHTVCAFSLAEHRAVECSASWPLGVVCCSILFKRA